MEKMDLSRVWFAYLHTLRNASTGKVSKQDIVFQLGLPVIIIVLLFLVWPFSDISIGNIASNVLTGVSIISSLMCGVAIMLFQLRVQISSKELPCSTSEETELIDETYNDVLWSVVVGFASAILIVVSYAIFDFSRLLWRICLSCSLGLIANLIMVSCMSIKRLSAAYEIVSKSWGSKTKS